MQQIIKKGILNRIESTGWDEFKSVHGKTKRVRRVEKLNTVKLVDGQWIPTGEYLVVVRNSLDRETNRFDNMVEFEKWLEKLVVW